MDALTTPLSLSLSQSLSLCLLPREDSLHKGTRAWVLEMWTMWNECLQTLRQTQPDPTETHWSPRPIGGSGTIKRKYPSPCLPVQHHYWTRTHWAKECGVLKLHLIFPTHPFISYGVFGLCSANKLGYWQTPARLIESKRERCAGLESFGDLFKGFQMGCTGTRKALTALYPPDAETGFSSDHMMNSHQTGSEQMWPTPNWATPTGSASASSLHINDLSFVPSWLLSMSPLCLFVLKHCLQKKRFVAMLSVRKSCGWHIAGAPAPPPPPPTSRAEVLSPVVQNTLFQAPWNIATWSMVIKPLMALIQYPSLASLGIHWL